MIERRAPQMAAKLGDQFTFAIDIFIGRMGREKIARIGQAIRSYRSQIRQPESGAKVLADIAARLPSGRLTLKRTPRGMTAISCGSTSINPSSVAISSRPCWG